MDQNSAVLGLEFPKEAQYLVPESNHSTICKFKSKDQNYEVIEDHLVDLIKFSLGDSTSIHEPWTERLSLSKLSSKSSVVTQEDLDTSRRSSYFKVLDNMQRSSIPFVLQEQVQASGPWFIRPNVGISKFTGREALLEVIQRDLTHVGSNQNRVAIHGLGGVGKTQIALKLIEWYRDTYPSDSIFWIRAGNSAVFFESLGDIADTCGLLRSGDDEASTLASIHTHLLDERNGWLIVADNADNCDTFANPLMSSSKSSSFGKNFHRVPMATLIPRCAHGRVLFTTNSKVVASQLVAPEGQMIEIPPMSQQEARELLQRQLDNTAPSSMSPPSYQSTLPSNNDIEMLATQLGNLPLAIAQAAAYIRVRNLTVSDYVAHVTQDDSGLSDLLEHNFQGAGMEDDFSKAVASTWKVAFDRIEVDCPAATELLSFIALLEPQNIPKSLLKQVQPDERQLTAISLGTLQAYALVTVGSSNESYTVHRLVQIAVKNRLKKTETIKECASKALAIFVKIFPQKEDMPSAERSTLLPHALQVLKNDFTDSDEDKIAASTLASNISHYYIQQGKYFEAVTQSRTAKEYLERAVKPPKSLLLSIQTTEALALRETGRLVEASELAKAVWLGKKKEHGAKADTTVKSYLALGLLYQDLGRYKESHKITKECVKILQKTHKEQDITLIQAKVRYGRVLYYLGDYAESEEILKETIGPAIRGLGNHHPVTLKIQYMVAFAVLSLGRPAECERLCSETLVGQNLALGEQHPETLKTLSLRAGALQALGMHDSAMKIQRQIYSKAVQRLGPNHRYTHLAANGLADTLSVLKENDMPSKPALKEAEMLYGQVLDTNSAAADMVYDGLESTRTSLANVLRLQGKPEEAEKMQRVAYEKLRNTIGKEHPLTLDASENLARCLKDLGKDKEAAKKANKVLDRREKALGWSHPGTVRAAKLVLELSPDSKGSEKMRANLAKAEAEQIMDGEGSLPLYNDEELKVEHVVKRKPLPFTIIDSKEEPSETVQSLEGKRSSWSQGDDMQ